MTATWFATAGLVFFLGAGWMAHIALKRVMEATAMLATRTKQMELLAEANALAKYGAIDEAAEAIEEAVAIGRKALAEIKGNAIREAAE